MIIDLTDQQINQILEVFWNTYIKDSLDYNIVSDWLNDNPSELIKFLDFGTNSYTKSDVKDFFNKNKEQFLD